MTENYPVYTRLSSQKLSQLTGHDGYDPTDDLDNEWGKNSFTPSPEGHSPGNPVDASGLFEDAEKHLAPPPWIDFNHPDFPEYFQIVVLDAQGKVSAWWQRVPKHLRDDGKFP